MMMLMVEMVAVRSPPQHNQAASQEIAGIIDLETQSSGREGLSSHGGNQKTYDIGDQHQNFEWKRVYNACMKSL